MNRREFLSVPVLALLPSITKGDIRKYEKPIGWLLTNEVQKFSSFFPDNEPTKIFKAAYGIKNFYEDSFPVYKINIGEKPIGYILVCHSGYLDFRKEYKPGHDGNDYFNRSLKNIQGWKERMTTEEHTKLMLKAYYNSYKDCFPVYK